jgi:hypothetical protein
MLITRNTRRALSFDLCVLCCDLGQRSRAARYHVVGWLYRQLSDMTGRLSVAVCPSARLYAPCMRRVPMASLSAMRMS